MAALKEESKKAPARGELEKARAEASRLSEELRLTRERLRAKGDELHERAVDLHTFEKMKGVKAELIRMEEEQERLRRVVELDHPLELGALRHELKRKNDALAAYERLSGGGRGAADEAAVAAAAAAGGGVEDLEVLASEPHRVITSVAAEVAGNASAVERLEALRHMFHRLEDHLLEARGQALQHRYTKEAAAAAQQRAERHLRDLMAVSPAQFASVDDVYSARIDRGAIYAPPPAAALAQPAGGAAAAAGSPRPSRERQLHDLQQVVEGLRQVVKKLQTDNDLLRKNGVSNQRHVEVLKENKALKQAAADAAAAAVAAAQKKSAAAPAEQAPPQAAAPSAAAAVATLKKRLREEAESVRALQATVAELSAEREAGAADRARAAAAEDAARAAVGDELEKLRVETRVMSEEAAAAAGENRTLRERVAKLEADLSLFDSEFLEEVAALQRQNEALQAANGELRDRVRVQGVLSGGDEPLVAGVAGLRGRASALRESMESLPTSSASGGAAAASSGGLLRRSLLAGGGVYSDDEYDDEDDSAVPRRIAAILRGVRGGGGGGGVRHSVASSGSVTSSTATLDLSGGRVPALGFRLRQ